jgi:hypothetical protein
MIALVGPLILIPMGPEAVFALADLGSGSGFRADFVRRDVAKILSTTDVVDPQNGQFNGSSLSRIERRSSVIFEQLLHLY